MKTDQLKNENFISFEGIDYSGKTTQINLLKEFLESRGYQVEVIREPGGTAISEQIRELLLDKKNKRMTDLAEIFLYSAARTQLITEKIVPQLKKGHFVIADRFVDSTTAYQGYGRQIDLQTVNHINQAATFGLLPGITFYLEISPDLAYRRRQDSGRITDRLEESGIEFFNRVFHGYKEIASQNSKRVHTLDASLPVEKIFSDIKGFITPRIAGLK